MKKILVTGGSGFVGQKNIPILLQNGYEVLALARSEKSAQQVKALGADTAPREYGSSCA